jgi:hypothetical protein
MLRSKRHVVLLVAVLSACAPRIQPLVGVPFADRLPATSLPARHERIVFRWQFDDRFFGARGEGAARNAPPDSARLDFFADGGLGGGYAILIGDSLFTPANDDARRYLPPVPLLWAAFGVLRVSASDTTAVLLGDTLSADIGASPTWRATFVAGELRSLARIDGKRLRENVSRDSTTIAYRNFGAHRRLTLTVLRRVQDPPFDEAIWRP